MGSPLASRIAKILSFWQMHHMALGHLTSRFFSLASATTDAGTGLVGMKLWVWAVSHSVCGETRRKKIRSPSPKRCWASRPPRNEVADASAASAPLVSTGMVPSFLRLCDVELGVFPDSFCRHCWDWMLCTGEEDSRSIRAVRPCPGKTRRQTRVQAHRELHGHARVSERGGQQP